MSDPIDQANDLALETTTALIAKQRSSLHQLGTPECEVCDDEIPAARRAVYPAARRCITCQERAERRTRQYGK